MRGKGNNQGRTGYRHRITPAYAGKSLNSTLILFMIKDHPRLCGEKWDQLQPNSGNRGSPPPMRGKGKLENWIKTTTRITPAYAGKRCGRNRKHAPEKDHPRLCGEKFCPCKFHSVGQGSPPPMRGKVTG